MTSCVFCLTYFLPLLAGHIPSSSSLYELHGHACIMCHACGVGSTGWESRSVHVNSNVGRALHAQEEVRSTAPSQLVDPNVGQVE